MINKRYLITIFVIAILLFCSRCFIFRRHINKLNAMSYVYDVPINKVRKNIYLIFSDGRFHGLNFQIGYDKTEKELNNLSDEKNKNHFFINWIGWESSGENSNIYYNLWGDLELIPRYHIILDSLSNIQTGIKIESLPKVKAGTEVSLNYLIPYFTSRKVNVEPSTIEEYEIIKLIGQ